MSKLKIASAVILLISLTSFQVQNQSIGFSSSGSPQKAIPDLCATENSAFQDGEELVYKLYYNWNFVWVSAGEVKFKVREVGNQYHLAATGSTYDSYDWIFKVRDNYQAYVDKNTLLPTLSIRDVQEGGYRLYDKLTYKQNHRKVSSFRGKTKDAAQETTYDVSDCVHDIVSIIYYLRNVNYENLKTDASIPMRIFIDKEELPLSVRYRGKEQKKHIKGLGKFNTIMLSPDVISGYVFSEDSKMVVHASDDLNRVPLLIESPISVGSVKAVLKSYKGLKYNLDSKIK